VSAVRRSRTTPTLTANRIKSWQPLPAHCPHYMSALSTVRHGPNTALAQSYYPSSSRNEVLRSSRPSVPSCVNYYMHSRHAQEPNTLRQPSLLHTDRDGCRLSQLYASQTTFCRSPFKLDLLGNRVPTALPDLHPRQGRSILPVEPHPNRHHLVSRSAGGLQQPPPR